MGYRIVVGVDGSENSEHALRWAVEEARLRGAELALVLAWQLPLIGIPGAFDRDELEQQAKEVLGQELAEIGSSDGARVGQFVVEGDPSACLISACERTDANLLVLGSRGREGFAGLRLGSVSQECALHAPCPVVIVKPPRPAAEGSPDQLQAARSK